MKDLIREILDFTLHQNTRKTVYEAFSKAEKILPIDCDFGSFRLLRVNEQVVNLEYLVQTKLGSTSELAGQFNLDGRLALPHELFEELKYSHGISAIATLGVSGFSILNNALIAAFSLKSALVVAQAKDAKEIINGLEIEYYEVEKNELNIYANDRYGLDPNTALAVGKVENGRIFIDPTMTYKSQVDYCGEMKLLSFFKMI